MKQVDEIINGVLTSTTVENTDNWNPIPKPSRREGEFREFLATFTDTEQAAIKTAAMNPSNIALALWYDKALGGATMSLDHSATDTGLSALVAAGLITSERKTEILATDFNLV